MKRSCKTLKILLASLGGLSLFLTALSAIVYFILSGVTKYYSYPLYQQISLFIYQTQDNILYAIFRIPGVFLLGGIVIYLVLFCLIACLTALIYHPFKKQKSKPIKEKNLTKKSFKVPSPLMFIKWVVLLAYFVVVFYVGGYYLNGITKASDVWMLYVLFYMYSILGGILVNHLFNLSHPLRSNYYFESGFLILLGAMLALSYFYLERFGISQTFYMHCCIVFGIVALLNAFNFTSIDAERCPKCGGRCVKTLIHSEHNDLGTSIGFEDCSRKVGTRETTYTISDDRGNVLLEAKGSEDIYEDYVGTYETEESETVNTYDCECIHCHHHETKTENIHHSHRV